jgi:branched-chain amino acid transport system permease protein
MIADIRLDIELWPAALANSLAMAGLLTMIGLSWVVIFRTTKVLNFAIGEFAVLGAYLLYVLTTAHLPWIVAAIGAIALTAVIGSITYGALLRRLAGRPHWAPAIVTMGVALVIDAVIAMVWGSSSVFLDAPVHWSVLRLGPSARLTSNDLIAIGSAAVLFVAVLVFLRATRVGVQMRAAAEHALLASQTAIRIDRMFALGWGFSAMVAAVGGISYAFGTTLTPSSVSIGILGLAPALVGGLDSVEGVVVGSILASLVINFSILYLGSGATDVTSSLLVLVILLVRPFGFFGTRDILRV